MKNKRIFKVDKNGNLKFCVRDRQNALRNKSDSIWNNTWVLMIILSACVVADFASFSSLFSAFLYDNAFLRNICIIGMLISFEVAPIYLANSLKRRACGYNVETVSIFIPLIAFLFGVIINIMLRIATKDIVFVDLSNLTTSVIGNSNTSESSGSSNPLIYSIFFGVLPIVTSLVAYAATYSMSNPLKKEVQKLRKEQIELSESKDQLDAIIAEYESDGNFLDRLLTDDDGKFNAKLSMLRRQCDEYFDYCRQRISQHIGTAAVNSYTVDYAVSNHFEEDDII